MVSAVIDNIFMVSWKLWTPVTWHIFQCHQHGRDPKWQRFLHNNPFKKGLMVRNVGGLKFVYVTLR